MGDFPARMGCFFWVPIFLCPPRILRLWKSSTGTLDANMGVLGRFVDLWQFFLRNPKIDRTEGTLGI